MGLIINFLAFQIGWFSAVISAAQNVPWIGALVILGAIGVHLLKVSRPGRELTLILLCGLIGAVWDSILVAAGWISYPSGIVLQGAAPYWIVGMWMMFATTLNVSLRWLKLSRLLAIGFGLLGGPLAYYTGYKLGGVQLTDFKTAMIALGIGWAVLTPLLLELASRFDGVNIDAESSQGWILE